MRASFPRLAVPILVSLFASTPSRADWRWLHPAVQGNSLRDVEFLDASTAIAVGDAGTILVSHDTGTTWSPTFRINGVPTALRKVARIDDLTAVVVGDAGVILKTSDAGTNWQTVPSGTTVVLEDVDFSGPVGVAIECGVIRRSTDAGETWESVPLPPLVTNVLGVDMVTSSIGYAVVAYGLLKSVDGGLTWDFTPEAILVSDWEGHVSFSDAVNGAISTGYPYMYVTHDGAVTWELHPVEAGYTESSATITDLEFVAPYTVFSSVFVSMCDIYTGVCSSGGEFFRSTDDGAFWSYEYGSRLLNGVAVNDAGVVLLVGDSGVAHRWVAPDAWEQTAGIGNSNVLDDPGCLAFLNADTGMLLGSSSEDPANPFDDPTSASVVIRTSTAGSAWSFSYWGWPYSSMKDVAYATGSPDAYAVAAQASGSVLLKSTDNGATWSSFWSAGSNIGLTALEFSSPTHGVSVGPAGSFAVIDGGAVTTGSIPAGIQNVAFADGSTVVAVGGTGPYNARQALVIRSTDGGMTWAAVASPTAEWLHDVGFVNSTVGAAVGTGGVVLRTDDGGLTWTQVSTPTTHTLVAVGFATGGYGIAVGSAGAALETTDAGLSWAELDAPAAGTLTDVVVLGPYRALVAGPELTALEYRENPVPTLFSSFDVAPRPFAAELRWSVQDEADLTGFRVLRREDTAAAVVVARSDGAARSYRDETVKSGASYEYVLVAVEKTGQEIQSTPVRVQIPSAALELLPNLPNPFNPSTTIRFVVPEKERVRLAVYDAAGRHVATLVDDVREPGLHSVVWNGSGAASGVYFARLHAGKANVSRKLVLLK